MALHSDGTPTTMNSTLEMYWSPLPRVRGRVMVPFGMMDCPMNPTRGVWTMCKDEMDSFILRKGIIKKDVRGATSINEYPFDVEFAYSESDDQCIIMRVGHMGGVCVRKGEGIVNGHGQ